MKTTTLIGQKKVTKRQTMVDKILLRKLKIEQHDNINKGSEPRKGKKLLFHFVTLVLLLLLQIW